MDYIVLHINEKIFSQSWNIVSPKK